MLPRTTFSAVFFCKKTKVTKKGKAPIYARITTTGQSTEVYTQCQIEPERWNQRLERSLYKDEVDQQINRIIASYRASILAAYDRLIQENKTPTCFAVKQLLGSASSSRMVLAEFGKYCEKRQQEVGTRITQLTANKYHRLLRYMTEYIRQMYGKEDLPLETVDLISSRIVRASAVPFMRSRTEKARESLPCKARKRGVSGTSSMSRKNAPAGKASERNMRRQPTSTIACCMASAVSPRLLRMR